MASHRWFAPISTLLITALAAIIRIANLANPRLLVFDETYYVKDAYTLGLFGSERNWQDNPNPDFESGILSGYLEGAAYVVHPPFGKWIIWSGLELFGADSSFGWRIATAVLGVLMVPLVILIARRLIGSNFFAAIAGLFMALEGLSITLARTAILDSNLAFFALLGFYFILLDTQAWSSRLQKTKSSALRFRPWLLLAGISLGLATGIKWSGLYFLAVFGLYTFVVDLWQRGRIGIPRILAVGQGALNAITLLVPALVSYLVTWLGWILGSNGWGRNAKATWYESLWAYHVNAYSFHTGLDSPHPYQSNAFGWLISLRPTAFFFERYEADSACGLLSNCTVALTAIPNLVIWIGGLMAIIWMTLQLRHKFDPAALAIISGFLAGWLPWVFFLNRTAFQFYAVAYAPYLAIALAFALHAYWRKGVARKLHSRNGAIALVVFATVFVAIYFMSIWTALPLPHLIWQLQMLFPFWV